MLAKTDLNLQEAVVTVRQLTQDEKIRQMCEAWEDYYRRTGGASSEDHTEKGSGCRGTGSSATASQVT